MNKQEFLLQVDDDLMFGFINSDEAAAKVIDWYVGVENGGRMHISEFQTMLSEVREMMPKYGNIAAEGIERQMKKWGIKR